VRVLRESTANRIPVPAGLQARPIFLAVGGGDSPHAAAVWGHAAKDCGAPIRRKGSPLKNLAGALHADGIGCTLSAGREVKMEIAAKV